MTAEGSPETAEQGGAASHHGWRDPNRSLLVAIVVTVLALPILVIDLLPTTPSEAATEVGAPAALADPTTTGEVTTTESEVETTTTTAAPTTTVAPTTASTWQAPTTTAAPTTTTTWQATTTTAAPVRNAAPATTAAPTTTAPPPPPPTTAAPTGSSSDLAFLACVRQRESGGYYGAVNPAGYYGAYQFAQSTWNNTASHAGRSDLVGVRPDRAAPADQDAMALHLLQWVGRSPWYGPGC